MQGGPCCNARRSRRHIALAASAPSSPQSTPRRPRPAHTPPPQVKGIIGGRAGKASKRVFAHGLTSIMTLDDVVDYASATSTTKNGHLGIKVG